MQVKLSFLPKGLLFDLDGTLLDRNKELRQDVRQLLDMLRRKGMKLGVATGRQYWYLREKIFPYFDLNDLHITGCGGEIVDSRGRVCCAKYLESEKIYRIYTRLFDKGARLHFGQGKQGFSSHLESARPEYVQKKWLIDPFEVGLGDWTTPLLTIDDLTQEVEQEIEVIRGEGWLGELTFKRMSHSKDTKAKSGFYYDVTQAGVNKGQALEFWARERGISPSEVIAFGDNENDLEILQAAGWGVAMKHGTKAALEAANQVVSGIDAGGLQEFLREILNGVGEERLK